MEKEVDFGQRECLVDRLRDILKRYSGEFCVFEELIQNADDAGATIISFIIDNRQLGTRTTFSSEFNQLQGPALLFWNNAVFSEADLEGLIRIGIGTKREDNRKTGRHGLGFNSVYHLTDAPQVLSNQSDYVILDPTCSFYPNIKRNDPGKHITISNFKKALNSRGDVFSGFQVPGFELNQATMFRLPLRTSPSTICDQVKTLLEIKKLIQKFASNETDFLLFLKNVTKIGFYEFSGSQMEMIEEKSINFPDRKDAQKRDAFRANLTAAQTLSSHQLMVPLHTTIYSAFIESKNEPRKEFLVLEQLGFDQTLDINTLLNKLTPVPKSVLKFHPIGSLALDMKYFSDDKESKSKLFCLLPLDQASPLVPHINASWALHQENRQMLHQNLIRSDCADHRASDWCCDWNLCIANGIVLPLFIKMLQQLKTKMMEFKLDSQVFAKKIIKLLPKSFEPHHQTYFEPMFGQFYKMLYYAPLLPIVNSTNQLNWHRPMDVLFTFENSLSSTEFLHPVVEGLGLVLCSQNQLICLFDRFGKIKLHVLKSSYLSDKLKAVSNRLDSLKVEQTFLKSVENVIEIIKFMLKEISYFNRNNQVQQILVDCPLAIRQDMVIKKIKPTNLGNLIFFDKPEFFPGYEFMFLNKQFWQQLSYDTGFKELFCHLSIQHLAVLLPAKLNPSQFQNAKCVIPSNTINNQDLNDIWGIISAAFDKERPETPAQRRDWLQPINDWSLVPIKKNSQSFLAPIKEAKFIIDPDFSSDVLPVLFKIGFAVYEKSLVPQSELVLKPILANLTLKEDFLVFMDSLSDNFSLIFADDNNRRRVYQYLSNPEFFQRNENSQQVLFRLENSHGLRHADARRIMSQLPIYEEAFTGRFLFLHNRTCRFIDLSQVPRLITEQLQSISRFQEDFYSFFNIKEQDGIVFVSAGFSSTLLFEYLGAVVITIDELYCSFFKWATEGNKLTNLADHVLLTKHLDLEGLRLCQVLKDVPFIAIDSRFYRANECFDGRNQLLKFAHPKNLLPDEYQYPNWLAHLKTLGLNHECTEDDCIETVNRLQNLNIEPKVRQQICEILFSTIDELDDPESFIEEIQTINFLPTGLSSSDEKSLLLKKIFTPGEKLACLNEVVLSEFSPIAWLERPILPEFLQIFINKKLLREAQINLEPNTLVVLKNLRQLAHRVEEETSNRNNFLSQFSPQELAIFEDIIEQHISWLEDNEDWLDELSPVGAQLKGLRFIPVKNRSNQRWLLAEPSQLVKNMKTVNQIDGFFYLLPARFLPFWDFFDYLGSSETVRFDQCATVLNEYYKTSNCKSLDEAGYKNVLLVIKLLIWDGAILDAPEEALLPILYFPNSLKQLKPANSLFYLNNLAAVEKQLEIGFQMRESP